MNTQTVIYWFRRDLRLDDNPSLTAAVNHARERGCRLLPVTVTPATAIDSPYGSLQRGETALAWAKQSQWALHAQLLTMGNGLHLVESLEGLRILAQQTHAIAIYCESIPLPQEIAEVERLGAGAPWVVHTQLQSTLFDADDLPFASADVPLVFTAFKQAIERAGLRCAQPMDAITSMPPPPDSGLADSVTVPTPISVAHVPSSSIGSDRTAGAVGAERHWQAYLDAKYPHRYFETRNQLSGKHFSSQLSIDLAWGTISPRRVIAMLDAFEAAEGESKSSYWLWFELMWREHFRWLHQRFGRQLFRARGLSETAPKIHARNGNWLAWCEGRTGQGLVDAAMRELAATGFMSNRMRQIVASYWIHDLKGDWRAGAAWFESQLCDEDCFSNTGNWLYIAGLGSDPRGGRRFDPIKQTRDHDPKGAYQRLWGVTSRATR